MGGATSIDITKPGIDKAYGIRKLRDILGIEIKEMIFIGDALFPGGNDHPARETGVVCIQVRDPNETKRVIEAILACMNRAQPAPECLPAGAPADRPKSPAKSLTPRHRNKRSPMNYLDRFKVRPGTEVKLKDIDPSFKGHHDGHKEATEEIEHYQKKLRELQELLYADGRRSLLICLQAIDGGGKDGTINHVLGAMNPQGCRVVAFKQPTAEELAHDFLWRVHPAAPGRGEVVIFNRSHYEDVLVVRVHNLVAKAVWSRRYDRINAFEKELAEGDTHILKFYLHISKEEQLKRFKDRLDDPAKQWKISESDYKERNFWDRLHGGLRGSSLPLQHGACAVVHHPFRPQMVPKPRRVPNRRRAPGTNEHAVPTALGGSRAHSQGVSHGEAARPVIGI